MVIETNSVEKNYAKECVNTVYFTKRLIKNPNRKVLNMFIIWPVYLTFASVVLVGLVLYFFMRSDVFTGVLIGAIAFCIFMGTVFYTNILKYRKRLVNRKSVVTFTFAEEGVEYDDHDKRKLMVRWNAVKAVKVGKYGFFLIPQDISVSIMGLPKEHLDEFKKFLEENNIELEFVGK